MAADKLVDSAQLDADLTTVADGIRYAGGTSAELSFPAGMAAAARALKPTGTKRITANGTVDVSGYASAEVEVSGDAPILQTKTVTPTKSQQTVTPDSGKDGLSSVVVEAIPSQYIEPSGTKQIAENGTVDVKAFASAQVNVQPALQTKTVTPTKSQQTVTPDSGKDGLSSVVVEAIPSQYIVPEGSQQITENGTYDVTGKASVVVNVAGSGGGSDLSALDIYIADFLTDVPAVTDGALDGYRRVLVA